MKTYPINLYGEQTTIFNDWLNTRKHSINIVPVGSGKTFLAALALPIFASDPKYHMNRDIVYSAPTMGMISTLIWEPLKRTCKEYFNIADKDINNSNMTIRFPNDIFIRCKSAEQRENLRGMNASIWIADEASLYTEDSLQEITNRLRPSVNDPNSAGRLIVISTPHGNGPLYSLFKAANKLPDQFIVRHYNYEQMRAGNLKYILDQKKILSPMKFASDYMCSFETISDQFFYAWDKHKFCKPVVDLGGDLYSGHDFNKRVMCAVVAQVKNPYKPNGEIEILKSYAINDCSTEGIAQAIRQDFPRRRINSVIDMSGTQVNRDTTSAFGITDRTILEKYGFAIINNRNSNPLIADTDNTSNAFINQGRLIINPDDERLLESLSTYHFEDGTRKKLVKYTEQAYAHIDGLGDSLRYLIHHLFPIRHDTGLEQDYVTSDTRFYKKPGGEHLPVSPLYAGGPTWEELLTTDGEQENDYQTW